jgi:tRNA pseudouridine55 synthase
VDGIILIDKDKGWTSFDVVSYIRSQIATERKVKPKSIKVGHIGTLDPMATGLLVILIGRENTKRVPEFMKLDKVYDVELTLGFETDSFDIEGNKIFCSDRIPDRLEIKRVLTNFVGLSSQRPPSFSALKINGQRAYKLARKGIAVELKERPINIYSITHIKYNYPLLSFRARVSSGTYIRSLGHDIGQSLQTGAYLSSLRRIKIGDFNIKDAQRIQKL